MLLKSRNMYKIFVTTLLASFIQASLSEVRDQLYLSKKVEATLKLSTDVQAEMDRMEPITKEKKEILTVVAKDFIRDVIQTMNILGLGVANNTRNNEQGKALYAIFHMGNEFKDWMQNNVNDNENKLFPNFKLCLIRMGNLVPAAKDSLAHIKESTYDTEVGTNAWLDSIDYSIFMFSKLYYHLKFRTYSNSQLRSTIQQGLDDAFKLLDQIPSKSYNAKEMATYAKQSNYLLGLLTDRGNNWLEHSNLKQSDLWKPAERVHIELEKLLSEIQLPRDINTSTAARKNSYKNWLRSIVIQINKMVTIVQEKSSEIARGMLFDTLGTVNFFKTIFGILSGQP